MASARAGRLMQLALPGRPHLTYCTNIHKGESWAEIEANLVRYLPDVKRRVCPDAPMGVGLRLSGKAAETLADPEALKGLLAFLDAHDLYVFTINAFPYGPFHGCQVKEQVYEPDWLSPKRLAYSNTCADILACLLPQDRYGTISTVPGAFKAKVRSADDVTRMAEAMIRHAVHLNAISERTGRTITLALEPEPCCLLETSDDAIAFFEEHVFCAHGVEVMSRLSGLAKDDARAALQRHLGLCFDVCHAAVEFEEPIASLARIQAAGITIAKLQLSSALKVAGSGKKIAPLLRAFDDGVYLHQTVESSNGRLTRHVDLPQALAALDQDETGDGEWRVHCHVPVFLESFEGIQSTQDVLAEVLAHCREQEVAPHFEVETYTWSVLPEALRQASLAEDIAREVTWVRSQLRA